MLLSKFVLKFWAGDAEEEPQPRVKHFQQERRNKHLEVAGWRLKNHQLPPHPPRCGETPRES